MQSLQKTIFYVLLIVLPTIVQARPPEPFADDLYLRLGLSSSANYNEIAHAFETLIGQYVKAVKGGAKPEALFSIFDAGSTLLDPEAKKEWDDSHLKLEEQSKLPAYEPAHPRWREVLTAARLQVNPFRSNSPQEIGIIDLEPTPELQVGRSETDSKPFRRADLITEEASPKLRRTDVLQFNSKYKAYRAQLRSKLFAKEIKTSTKKEGEKVFSVEITPRAAENLLRAQLTYARSAAWPGWAFGLAWGGIALTVWDSFVPLTIGSGFLISDFAIKFWAGHIQLPKAVKDLNALVAEQMKAKPFAADATPHRSELGNALIYFDTWHELFAGAISPKRSDYLTGGDEPQDQYLKTYQEHRPLEGVVIQRALGDPAFARALAYRMLQNKIANERLLPLMARNAEFWLQIGASLQNVISEAQGKECQDAATALHPWMTYLRNNRQGPVTGRLQSCRNSLASTAYAFRKMMGR